ncbi:hypothetical protein SPLC1_S240500 [Arthrospira platensis C1]|nr:hypothetical protein SPLC1_S240500 [Arthrospira platensis C1]
MIIDNWVFWQKKPGFWQSLDSFTQIEQTNPVSEGSVLVISGKI